MDLEAARHRSASQGSLHSVYRTHGRPTNYSHPRPPSQRRPPLRNLTETPNMLRSPGPLESMLKTTTETGDIGLFSIKPTNSPTPNRRRPKKRPSVGENSFLQRPYSRGLDEGYAHDNRKELPSYRDTTSEIISLYGPVHPSYSAGSHPPSIDDGQRSYSITTCGSGKVSLHKSTCTAQSLPTAAGLQRPRSPFPYPARLRRPGVRPCSPAMTESGVIDYSRMIELDRSSYRNNQALHRPAPSSGNHRFPPLSSRRDMNRSTSSLPTSMMPSFYGPMPNRSRTPNWVGYYQQRSQHAPLSSDQSIRSNSLNSILDMYQRPPTSNSQSGPMPPAASFYYDYTENFETDDAAPDSEVTAPFCPIPQRAGSNSKPMVLREDSHDQLDVVETPENDQMKSSSEQTLDAGAPESQVGHAPAVNDETRTETKHPSSESKASTTGGRQNENPGECTARPKDNSSQSPCTMGASQNTVDGASTGRPTETPLKISCPAPRLGVVKSPEAHEPNSPQKTDYRPESPKNARRQHVWPLNDTLPNVRSASSPQKLRASHLSFSKSRNTLDPSLSEFASLVNNFDKITKVSSCKNDEDGSRSPRKDSKDKKTVTRRPVFRRTSAASISDTESRHPPFKRHHRRNLATAWLDPSSHPPGPGSPDTNSTTHVLFKNCVFPSQLRKVASSTPRLMKSLPPLPSKAEGTSNSPPASSSAEEVSTNLLFTSSADGLEVEHGSKNVRHLTALKTTQKGIERLPKTRRKHSRIKLRAGASQSQKAEDKGGPDLVPVSGKKSEASKVPKLRLKVSRKPLAAGGCPLHGVPMIRSPSLKKCDSFSELGDRSKQDIYTNRCSLEDAFHTQLPDAAHTNTIGASVSHADPSTQQSEQFDISYPPSQSTSETVVAAPMKSFMAMSDTQDRASRSSLVKHAGGLRCKISLLGLRSAGSVAARCQKGCKASTNRDGGHKKKKMARQQSRGPRGVGLGSQRRNVGFASTAEHGRLKRWAVEAHRAVRLCVRRTFDRRSQSRK